jgi:hypothetical protein
MPTRFAIPSAHVRRTERDGWERTNRRADARVPGRGIHLPGPGRFVESGCRKVTRAASGSGNGRSTPREKSRGPAHFPGVRWERRKGKEQPRGAECRLVIVETYLSRGLFCLGRDGGDVDGALHVLALGFVSAPSRPEVHAPPGLCRLCCLSRRKPGQDVRVYPRSAEPTPRSSRSARNARVSGRLIATCVKRL